MSYKKQLQENNLKLDQIENTLETFPDYENITEEVTAQVSLISGISTNLGVIIDEPNGSNKEKLQVNNNNLQKISELPNAEEVTW